MLQVKLDYDLSLSNPHPTHTHLLGDRREAWEKIGVESY